MNEIGDLFRHLIMDIQDFLIQGEGREEDKRQAWDSLPTSL